MPKLTATEVLRRMLTERGVEWMPVAWNPKRETFYHAANGVGFCADEYTDGVKIYTDATITPEQAIAATLGRGECKLPETRIDHGIIEYNGVTEWRRCNVCGAEVLAYPARYCPNCGRRIEEDE